ncbi:ABC transporter ATP-binding protein [Pseudohongiella sp. O18]|uniref:ABC transporter ATP-binding protein n=1 Tax=Pseudohongiella sp. O18 TaxID=2904248 RepID=UPI001F4803BB|nr:ABC transporter ATP-binding protein [Pseudohongiella sp. O18]
MKSPLLTVSELSLCSPGGILCEPVSLSLNAGERLAILGKNGTGKTTLLHTLCGLQPVTAGAVSFEGLDLRELSGQQTARLCGMLFQHEAEPMPATVYEVVMLGRLPHARQWHWESRQDHDIVQQSLKLLNLSSLATRDIHTLSGGERQRVAIAAVLAQQPRVFMLDEPSNHLDIAFQIQALNLLCERVSQDNTALIMATHDINLAARFCTHVLLLNGKGGYRFGDTASVLDSTTLSDAFECRVDMIVTPERRLFFPA